VESKRVYREETEQLLSRDKYVPRRGEWMYTGHKLKGKDQDEEGRDASRGALGFWTNGLRVSRVIRQKIGVPNRSGVCPCIAQDSRLYSGPGKRFVPNGSRSIATIRSCYNY
jgi:hypothetical protein